MSKCKAFNPTSLQAVFNLNKIFYIKELILQEEMIFFPVNAVHFY